MPKNLDKINQQNIQVTYTLAVACSLFFKSWSCCIGGCRSANRSTSNNRSRGVDRCRISRRVDNCRSRGNSVGGCRSRGRSIDSCRGRSIDSCRAFVIVRSRGLACAGIAGNDDRRRLTGVRTYAMAGLMDDLR